MALTLDDIIAAPSDPVALNAHLQQRGLIPLAPPPAPGLPPANIGALSPVAPRSEIKPMIPPSPVTPNPAPEIAGTPPPTGEINPLPTMKPPTLTHSEKMALPLTAPSSPIGSAAYTENELERLQEEKTHPWGSAENHPGLLGKIGHGLARTGEVAADILAPGLTQAIPGTPENRGVQANALKRELASRTAAEGQEANRKSEEALRGAQTEEAKVRTEAEQAKLTKEQAEQSLEKDAQGNVVGWKDAQGKLHGIEEEGTPQAVKDIAKTTANKIGPKLEKMDNGDIVQITTDKDGKAHSQVVYTGNPKIETDIVQRSVNGQEHHFLVNKKTGEDIKDLGQFKAAPSAAQELTKLKADEEPVIGFDKDGTQRLMSRGQAEKEGLQHIIKASDKDRQDAGQNSAVLNDMTAKVRNLVASSKAVDKLGVIQKTLIQAALRGGPDDMATRLAVSQMEPEAKAFYQDVTSLREAALALPKQTTGAGRVSETQAHALWSTVPGSAGDHNFRLGQLKKFDENTERLWRKVPMVEGNVRERAFEAGQGGPPGPPAAGMKWQQNKRTGEYRQVKATP